MFCCPIANRLTATLSASTMGSMCRMGYFEELGEDSFAGPLLFLLQTKFIEGDRLISNLLGQFAIETLIKIPSANHHLPLLLQLPRQVIILSLLLHPITFLHAVINTGERASALD